MDINEDVLRTAGFVKDPRRRDYWLYKNVGGTLFPEAGLFFFAGFGPCIGTISDLKYLLMLIDYNWQASLKPYPSHEN